MQRYFIYFSYNGTHYHGWQNQPNGISVQEMLEKALSTVLRTDTQVVGAGRTDSGVHARLMVAHFNASTLPDLLLFSNKLNSILPNDIAVYKVVKVTENAHARFDAISRRYEYHLVTEKSVFRNGLAARFANRIDFDKMNEAAAILPGYTDFTSFSKLHTDVKTNNCKINTAYWEKQNDVWVFTIEADRFLRNMVRAIVGTLLDVGHGKLSIEEFKAVIEAKDRCKAGASVPACGLYLVDIRYPNDVFE
ncbi:MAG: tRNA pseudouridine(38-40) synthase TruA [Paludibacter sp.]